MIFPVVTISVGLIPENPYRSMALAKASVGLKKWFKNMSAASEEVSKHEISFPKIWIIYVHVEPLKISLIRK